MGLSDVKLDWNQVLKNWLHVLKHLLTEPSALFWWPTLAIALLGVAALYVTAQSHAIHRSHTGSYLKELPLDLICLLAYTFTQVAMAPVAVAITVAGTTLVLMAAGIPAVSGADYPFAVDGFVALLVFLAADFALYWSHRLFHRFRPLWALHKLHHQPTVLTPITAFRFWPPETAVHLCAFALGEGIALGIAAEFLGLTLSPIKFAGINIFLAAWYLAFSHLRHSNVAFYFPMFLSRLLVSPHMHQAHHSSDPMHHHRNFGTALSLWDWLFGTLYIPPKDERFEFGLGVAQAATYRPIKAIQT